jgi:hypothetical protein
MQGWQWMIGVRDKFLIDHCQCLWTRKYVLHAGDWMASREHSENGQHLLGSHPD